MKTPTKKQWEKWVVAGELPFKQQYYTPQPHTPELYICPEWWGRQRDMFRIQRNMACRTPREAIAKARKMLEAIR